MILYYSNSDRPGKLQPSAYKSLGGYCSGSSVPNNFLGNLFSDIAIGDLQSRGISCVCIFIFNDTSSPMTNVELFYIYTNVNPQAKIEISSVAVSVDQNGCPFVELIPNSSASPFNAEFVDASSAYESGIMTVTSAGQNGEVISIYNGATLLCATTPLSQATPTIADTVNAILTAMNGNSSFTAIAVTPTAPATLSQILFTNLTIGDTESEMILETSGTAYAANAPLIGGLDQSCNIGTIAPKGSLAIWIKRTVNSQSVIDQYTNMIDNQVISFPQPTNNVINPPVLLSTQEVIDFHFNF